MIQGVRVRGVGFFRIAPRASEAAQGQGRAVVWSVVIPLVAEDLWQRTLALAKNKCLVPCCGCGGLPSAAGQLLMDSGGHVTRWAAHGEDGQLVLSEFLSGNAPAVASLFDRLPAAGAAGGAEAGARAGAGAAGVGEGAGTGLGLGAGAGDAQLGLSACGRQWRGGLLVSGRHLLLQATVKQAGPITEVLQIQAADLANAYGSASYPAAPFYECVHDRKFARGGLELSDARVLASLLDDLRLLRRARAQREPQLAGGGAAAGAPGCQGAGGGGLDLELVACGPGGGDCDYAGGAGSGSAGLGLGLTAELPGGLLQAVPGTVQGQSGTYVRAPEAETDIAQADVAQADIVHVHIRVNGRGEWIPGPPQDTPG
jgi:hypothetical protein